MSKVFIATGCYVDSTWGVYGAQQACVVARDLGWSGVMPTSIEHSWDVSEEAIDWLNDNVAEDGYGFGWHDCELFYWSQQEWEDALGVSN